MEPNTWKRREAPLPCIWRRAKRAAIYMLSLLILLFIVFLIVFFIVGLTFLEGSFATMGPAWHGSLAPERQVQGVWGAGSPPGNVGLRMVRVP